RALPRGAEPLRRRLRRHGAQLRLPLGSGGRALATPGPPHGRRRAPHVPRHLGVAPMTTPRLPLVPRWLLLAPALLLHVACGDTIGEAVEVPLSASGTAEPSFTQGDWE